MEHVHGYIKVRCESKFLKLRNARYGLKQTSPPWNIRFDTDFKENGFSRLLVQACTTCDSFDLCCSLC